MSNHFAPESFLDDGDDYVFIEWPQIVQPMLPPTHFDIHMLLETPPTRKINAEVHLF